MSESGVTPWLIRIQNEMNAYCQDCKFYDVCPLKPTLKCSVKSVVESLEKLKEV